MANQIIKENSFSKETDSELEVRKKKKVPRNEKERKKEEMDSRILDIVTSSNLVKNLIWLFLNHLTRIGNNING